MTRLGTGRGSDGTGSVHSGRWRARARLVAAVVGAAVCVVLDLGAAYAVASSFSMSPGGAWDDDVLTAVQVSACAGGALAVLGGAVRAVPVARGRLRWWSLLLPAVLVALAVLRFVWVDLSYPT
ncbi:hypothetical protein [Saccharopolyspora hordei]|uniref:Uncharacterized protein n=1 Tax=Saccharopolyspora hordei TaxID=1838 RepID=A0A853ANL7_9PSEU|nr:hypothetical protein [Saccharopolyspora hordei]NYI85758.1 hypothetical protein [Saccharopolyspora hordei]